MTAPASHLRTLVDGVGALLSTGDTGLSYLGADTTRVPLIPMRLPRADLGPVRAIALAPYPLTADPTLNSNETGLQFMCRGASDDVRDVWQLEELVTTALLGRFPVTLPNGLRISALTWSSGGSNGQDDGNRCLWVVNYTARHARTVPFRN